MANLFKEKLNANNKRIGVFFLTGAPVHLGHYQAVVQAKRENDGCVVILSGRKGDRGDDIGLPLHKRFRYTRELFADDKEVYVTYVDETDMPDYPLGWEPWLEAVTEEVNKACSGQPKEYIWYVGEEDYKKELENRLDDSHTVKLLDRSVLPISGTLIRSKPLRYWNYITRPFRRHFSMNILITGTASGGKTTLVRDLARSLGATFTDEYARRYEEESNISDEELVASDFQYLASGQFDNNQKAIQSPANNGIFIADSNVTTTRLYSEEYLTEDEHVALLPSYKMLEKREKWDLILIVPPVTEYVDDGFRDMSHANDETRQRMHNRLLEMIRENGWLDETILLDAPGTEADPEGFYSRYKQALEIITYYYEHLGGKSHREPEVFI